MDEQKYFSLPEGATLKEKYRIDAVLGRGGFGITYRGTETNIGLRIAIKEYYPYGSVLRDTAQSPEVTPKPDEHSRRTFEEGKRVFLEEARRLAMCDHIASVVGVRDYFEDNGTAYIVMEYLDGVTLKAHMKDGAKMDAARLCGMMIPLLRDLQKIHETGLVHRDISPDNIMLVGGKTLRLMDFGAARAFAERGDNQHSMTVMLKQGYAPIEQYARHGDQGPWTDVYAMAATIYACLTGREPDPSVDRIIQDRLPLPSETGVNIPRRLEQVIMKNLSVQAGERCQSAGEMARELENALEYSLVPPPDPAPAPPWRKMAIAAAAAAVLGAAVLIAPRVMRPAEDTTSVMSTKSPVAIPTEAPTAVPTEAPTAVPTEAPTAVPTEAPTAVPTEAPTAVPTEAPTAVPTEAPTAVPTEAPTEAPTPEPTAEPRVSADTVFIASASSVYQLKYNNEYTVGADMAVDGDLRTAWNEGAEGRGIGEWIELRPTDGKKRVYDGFTIANGFQYHDYRKGDRWSKNNRVETLGVYADGAYIGSYPVSDVYDGYDTVYFDKPVYAGTLRFVIEDTVFDADFGDTCISEIRPF